MEKKSEIIGLEEVEENESGIEEEAKKLEKEIGVRVELLLQVLAIDTTNKREFNLTKNKLKKAKVSFRVVSYPKYTGETEYKIYLIAKTIDKLKQDIAKTKKIFSEVEKEIWEKEHIKEVKRKIQAEGKYYITRKDLEKLKQKYGKEKETDKEFLEWWGRNCGTGYEAFELIYIDEDIK